jgi:hypothetical protein
MPATQPTLGSDGPIPAPFVAIAQALQRQSAATTAMATQTSGSVLDQYANTTLIQGALNQIVTIGAGWIGMPLAPIAGVEVGTGLTGFGIAYPSGFAYSLITTTAGSTAATLTGGTTGFTNGYQIGATEVDVPDMGATEPGPYVAPGTTYTISGTSVILSQAALLSGSGLYCCTVLWNLPGSTNPASNVHP